jgi:hypothetical protein
MRDEKMTSEDLLEWAMGNPGKLFQIDGLGALLSALMLGFALVSLEKYFGIPKSTLYILAFVPCFFAAYDLYCYSTLNGNVGPYLIGIGIANLLYCFLSIGFAVYHHTTITILGSVYIVIELIIVCTLAIFEIKTARAIQSS